MDSKQKEYLWLFIIIMFYILTAYWGIYDVGMVLLWPLFALPMSLILIKTDQKETIALVGVGLSVIISFISTSTFNPIVMAAFLLFILVPSFVCSMLYRKKVMMPKIIMTITIVYFSGLIVFFTLAKIVGVDYLEGYFRMLDKMQELWISYLSDSEVQQLLPEGENILELYMEVMAGAILAAKRTYPATLFTISLITSTIHLFLVQLVARIRSWSRPAMKDILNVGLSRMAALVLILLWIVTASVGTADNIWTFAAESMLRVLFTLFQVTGTITVIVMIKKVGKTKLIRVILSIFSLLWLIFNPTLLILIGCMDSIFDFRKSKGFI